MCICCFCQVCDYGAGGATCSRWTNSMYLHNSMYVEECPAGDARDGRECI